MESVESPLSGVRILEMSALGPTPYGVMLLSDMGASVWKVDRSRPTPSEWRNAKVLGRNRKSISVDLKSPDGLRVMERLVAQADVFVEGYRPGVAERLGIGPERCLEMNPRLVYARMTGWGNDGPLAQQPGHDINYAGLTGGLHLVGPRDLPPPSTLTFLGDFGGGGTFLAIGVLAALVERGRSGRGQVVDVSMLDGLGTMLTYFHGLLNRGKWSLERESNFVDGAAPYYRTYETLDGGYMAVGAMEPQFYERFLRTLGIDPESWPQHDESQWPARVEELIGIFRSRTREEWTEVFGKAECCVTPVLRLDEAPQNEHIRERQGYLTVGEELQPRPAPRFSRTATVHPAPAPLPGEQTSEILAEAGFSADEIAVLTDSGAVGRAPDACPEDPAYG